MIYRENKDKKYMDEEAYKFLKKCKNILDVGCGFGRFIKQNPRKIEGIDINKNSVAYCKRRGFKTKKGNVLNLPFKSNSFEGVHCSHVIEHLTPDNALKLLKEIKRVLKHNGIFVLRTPYFHAGFFSTFDHIKPYYPKTIEYILCNSDNIQDKYNKIGGFKTIDLYNEWDFNLRVLARGILPLHLKGYMLVLKKVIK